MIKRSIFVFALLLTTSILPAKADDVTTRLDQLEQALRQLTGQVEELTFQLKQLRAENQKLSAAQPPAPVQEAAAEPAPQLQRKKASALVEAPAIIDQSGVEQIGEAVVAAPDGSKPLGAEKPVQAADGGFQGEVLVDVAGVAQVDPNATVVQEVAAPIEVAVAATPDEIFLGAEKSLLQMQYAEAEVGFKDFLSKFPTHNLAGSAEFKLGETFWARQDYGNAAQSYMNSYKQYPKGRRAPDSLLKLGLSLNRLGQQDQGCAMIAAVETEYPKAVEVKKRAQAEFRRAGCS